MGKNCKLCNEALLIKHCDVGMPAGSWNGRAIFRNSLRCFVALYLSLLPLETVVGVDFFFTSQKNSGSYE